MQACSYLISEIHSYVHPKKEGNGILTHLFQMVFLPKCRADKSFLAEIITRKFADHLPHNRIAEILSRDGVRISRKLLSEWVIRSAMTLKLLFNEMLKRVLESKNIYIDQIPVKKCKQTYMWVLLGGNKANPPYRIYQFKENRNHENVFDILKDYRGGLHSDF